MQAQLLKPGDYTQDQVMIASTMRVTAPGDLHQKEWSWGSQRQYTALTRAQSEEPLRSRHPVYGVNS
jgi:hypothetical protein